MGQSSERLFTTFENVDLVLELRRLTPAGAPALRIWPPNIGPGWEEQGLVVVDAEVVGREVVLPLTAPPVFDYGERWISQVVAAVRRSGSPLSKAAQETIISTLAPGGDRDDGLPAYEPFGPHVGAEGEAIAGALARPQSTSKSREKEHERAAAELFTRRREIESRIDPKVREQLLQEVERKINELRHEDLDYDYEDGRVAFRQIVAYEETPVPLPNGRFAVAKHRRCVKRTRRPGDGREIGRNRTAALREVIAAVCFDVLGASAHQVGTLLGMTPDRRSLGEAPPGARVTVPVERSAAWRGGSGPYDAASTGRSILAQLGCWPWVHAPEGKLPRRWRADEAFAEPLRAFVAAHG